MMNYKNIIAVICINIILFSGCGMRTVENDNENKRTPANEDIIISAGGMNDYGDYDDFVSLDHLLASSDAIIYGEVTDYEMAVSNHSSIINTFETIRVIETLHGDFEPNEEITLLENGGYMLIKDYLNSINKEDRQWYLNGVFKNLTNEDKNTKYYSEVHEGYYYPEIGDRAVYYLQNIEDMGDIYRRTGAWQGKYREIEEGILALPDESNSLSDPEKTYNSGTITYEELKEQILEAAGKLQ